MKRGRKREEVATAECLEEKNGRVVGAIRWQWVSTVRHCSKRKILLFKRTLDHVTNQLVGVAAQHRVCVAEEHGDNLARVSPD